MEAFISHCKTLTISELFDLIKKLYNSRELEKLEIVTSLFLEYFDKLNDERVDDAKFYQAFARHLSKPNLARQGLEALLRRSPTLNQDTLFYAKCNLQSLYSYERINIPKIIHLIYFGETKFYYFQYICVKSILTHLPEHQIIIYNGGQQPKNNEYWQEIICDPRVKIEIITVPTEYDGFPLQYFQYKADVVRLEQLYETGGIYLDLDLLIVKNFESLFKDNKDLYLSFETPTANMGPPISGGLINCFIAAKPKNEFLKIWLDSFKTGLRMENWAYHIRDSNRHLLNENPHYLIKYNIEILPSINFCPFLWAESEKFKTIPESITDDRIYGVHLFETITQKHLEKNPFFQPPKNNGSNSNDKNCTQEEDNYSNSNGTIDEKIVESTATPIVTATTTTANNNEKNTIETKNELSVNKDRIYQAVGLTLKETPERQDHLVEQLKRFQLDKSTYIMQNELHEKPGIGCFLAHINAIRWAKEQKLEEVLIFEDDILIQPQFNINNRPLNQWDMLYFGGILTKFERKDPGSKWLQGTIWCNHAYVVHSRIFDEILETFETIDLEDCAAKKQTIDWFYTSFFHKKKQCWLLETQDIIQKEGYSTLDKKVKWGKDFNWDTWTLKQL